MADGHNGAIGRLAMQLVMTELYPAEDNVPTPHQQMEDNIVLVKK